MVKSSYNCIVCASEFELGDLRKVSVSKINSTKFKICQSCIDKSDPADDYKQARNIVQSYLGFAQAKTLLDEAKSIIDNIKK